VVTVKKDQYCAFNRCTEQRLEKHPLADEYVDIWSEINRMGTIISGLLGFILGAISVAILIYLMVVM
jgi:hypothetical protein